MLVNSFFPICMFGGMILSFFKEAAMSQKHPYLQYILPKKALTWIAGCCANVRNESFKNRLINAFIDRFGVNMQEAVHTRAADYPTFNDFFIRTLKPQVRPMADAELICPVDGMISEMGDIQDGRLIQAKGHDYTVDSLLAGMHADLFHDGQFATLYLSPKDYHRIHMPVDATVSAMTYVPGHLFSVSVATTQKIPGIFSRNERLVVYFDTANGPMVMVLVGATIVGAINVAWYGDLQRSRRPKTFDYQNKQIILQKGQEMGHFKLGSTVIVLFPKSNRVEWEKSFCAKSPIRLGQAMGSYVKKVS